MAVGIFFKSILLYLPRKRIMWYMMLLFVVYEIHVKNGFANNSKESRGVKICKKKIKKISFNFTRCGSLYSSFWFYFLWAIFFTFLFIFILGWFSSHFLCSCLSLHFPCVSIYILPHCRKRPNRPMCTDKWDLCFGISFENTTH